MAVSRSAEWGWLENAFRTFANTDGLVTVSASLHRFAIADGAAEAMPFSAKARATAVGLADVAAGAATDEIPAFGGSVAKGHQVAAYLHRSNVLARTTVVVPTAEAVEAEARAVL